MKQLITLVLLFVATLTFAQTRGINYKAKLADNAGITLANQNATVQFSIYEGNMGNNLVYQEEHTTTTDANGIVILNIGEGTNLQGDFTTINWGFDAHWLKTEVDTGSGFVEIGNTEFKTVPYALHARTAESAGGNTFSEASPNLISANNTVADFVVGSPNTEDQNNVNYDGRMFWDDSKAAFRVGSADGTQWNDVNRGLYSFAAGQNNTASGINSVAFGNNNTAQSSGILISGKNNTANASAPYSLIGGFDNISTAAQSLVVGRGNIAATNFQAVVGKYNNSVTGNLFTVGNGVDDNNRSNALEVNENGSIKINDLAGSDTRNVIVRADGRLDYEANTTETKQYIISPCDFSTDQDFILTKFGVRGNNNDSTFYASVQLPTGTYITRIIYYLSDGDPVISIQAKLEYQDFDPVFESPFHTTFNSNSEPIGSIQKEFSLGEPISAYRSLQIIIESDNGNWIPGLRIEKVIIEYTE